MRLSAKPIVNYGNINNFDYGNQWTIRAGDPNTLYFQLVDLDKTDNTLCKAPLRYMPQPTSPPATLNVIFPSIDDAVDLTVAASQVSGDASLWKVDLTPSQVPGTGSVQFALTVDGAVRRFSVSQMMSVEYPDSDGSC